MAALWTVEYVGGAIRVRRHRSQADAEAYLDAVLRADGRFLTRCTVGSGEAVRVAMVNRLELAGVGCRSRLMRTSLKRLVELTDEFCC